MLWKRRRKRVHYHAPNTFVPSLWSADLGNALSITPLTPIFSAHRAPWEDEIRNLGSVLRIEER